MSLEVAIQENTAAIRELIATIAKGVPTTAAQVAAVVAEAPTAETKAAKGKSEAKAEAKAESADVTQDLAASKTAAQAEEALNGHANAPASDVTYDDVKAAIVKLSGAKSRDDVVALLSQFGVTKGPDLKPAQYPHFVDAAQKLIEA